MCLQERVRDVSKIWKKNEEERVRDVRKIHKEAS